MHVHKRQESKLWLTIKNPCFSDLEIIMIQQIKNME